MTIGDRRCGGKNSLVNRDFLVMAQVFGTPCRVVGLSQIAEEALHLDHNHRLRRRQYWFPVLTTSVLWEVAADITSDRVYQAAEKVLLPGVGSFDHAVFQAHPFWTLLIPL